MTGHCTFLNPFPKHRIGVSVPGIVYRLGESRARIIIAIGFYEDLGISPTYEDLARATGRALEDL